MFVEIALAIQMAIGVAFLWSGFVKARHPIEFIAGLKNYDLIPEKLVPLAALCLIALEFSAGVSHVAGIHLGKSLPIFIGMLSVFSTAVIISLIRGKSIPCMCFGYEDEVISASTLFRLGLLIGGESLLWRSYSVGASIRLAEPLNGSVPVLIPTVGTGVLLLALSTWILRTPDLVSLWSSCATCGRKHEPVYSNQVKRGGNYGQDRQKTR